MPDRDPEPWAGRVVGPFLTLERARATVEVRPLGDRRHKVVAPDQEQLVPGSGRRAIGHRRTRTTRLASLITPQFQVCACGLWVGEESEAKIRGEGGAMESWTTLAERRVYARPSTEEDAQAALQWIAVREGKTLVELVEELHAGVPLPEGDAS